MYELLLLLFVSLLALGIIPAYADNLNDGSWNFGEGLSQGDAFLYDICDEKFSDSYTGDYGRCYLISLDVKNELNIKNNTFYLIHAVTKDYIGTEDRLFLMDSEQYSVKSIFVEDADYASSLQNTIFWQNGWVGKTIPTAYGSESILLERGNPESAMVLSDSMIAQNGAVQYTISHDSFESSYFAINDLLPFPVYSDIFTYGPTEQSTRHVFSFELQNYTVPSTTDVIDTTTYPEIHNDFFEVNWR